MCTLASTSFPFRPKTVQMPNLALIEKKRITVWIIEIVKARLGATCI
jgi:hypothetical protein